MGLESAESLSSNGSVMKSFGIRAHEKSSLSYSRHALILVGGNPTCASVNDLHFITYIASSDTRMLSRVYITITSYLLVQTSDYLTVTVTRLSKSK